MIKIDYYWIWIAVICGNGIQTSALQYSPWPIYYRNLRLKSRNVKKFVVCTTLEL